ncbi:unnamed protein product, partial [Echinostoma caproni]|uniref:Kringle domain-containing protein n=1 Tax=Echinostoma caproni TaxID=27848 RepID=A0A183AA17_9TREM
MQLGLDCFSVTVLLYCHTVLNLCLTPTHAEQSEECMSADQKPGTYRGKVNVAYDGTPCEEWSKHHQFYRRKWTTEEAIQQKNYCRNPDGDINGPWCVVPNNSFRYCNIPTCAQDVQCYEGKGEDYIGDQQRTISGMPCQLWTHVNAIKLHKSSYRFRLYENETNNMTLHFLDHRLEKFRSCRNPGGTRSRPWCYSTRLTESQNVIFVEKDCFRMRQQPVAAPSVLGYPLSWNDTVCPPGFHRQTQISMESADTRVEIDYCVAPERLLHRIQRQTMYAPFVEFCLYLISSANTCPAGFRSMDKFQLVLDPIKHLSGPAAWRAKAESLIQSILCCSDPDYFRPTAPSKPYITIEKVSRYKRFEDGMLGLFPLGRRNSSRRRISLPMLVSMGIEEDQEETVNDQPDLLQEPIATKTEPLFASVRQCPPVENTSRVLMLAMTPRVRPGQGLSVLQALPPEVICEYYALQAQKETVKSTLSGERSVVLIVDEPLCPPGFNWLPMPFPFKLILGASKGLCRPTDSVVMRQPPSSATIGYCMLSMPDNSEELREPDVTNADRGRRTDFPCPDGFRQNEIYFHEREFRIRLCCVGKINRYNESDTPIPLQAPFAAKIPFAVLQNGDRCPQFYLGSVKLLSVEYSRTIPHTYLNRLEMFGPDHVVKLVGIPNLVLCQYFSVDLKLGVKSLTFECDGLGSRISMGPYGANCGFKVNDSITFPPGRYCLLQFSSTCPPGFTHRSGSMAVGLRLRSVGNTCCREDETIGAIQFPIPLAAPFKLPAVRAPCQTIEGFNVDAELGHCLYYPRGDTPQALMVWPRILGTAETPEETTAPAHCALSPRRMQDHWLVSRRTRWNGNLTDNVDVCFNEVPWSLMPPSSKSGKPYCTFVFGSCPKPYFETVGSSIYFNTVLCCTMGSGNADTVEYSKRLRSMVTLGHPTPHDMEMLRGVLGTRVLETNPDSSGQSTCPEFDGVLLRRRVTESVIAPSTSPTVPVRLALLFNATHVSDSLFTAQTGIWMQDGLVHVIYCEYNSKKLDDYESGKKIWPFVDFAIPKALNDCPSGSTKAIIRHHQDQYGFHYSQPIHLDGLFLRGEKATWLEYCVFKTDASSTSTFNYGIRDELPAGHYCVLRVRGSCPSGFTKGVLNIMEGPQKVDEAPTDAQSAARYADAMDQLIVPDIQRVRVQMKDTTMKMDRLDYYFCCRADSPSADIPIQGFPSESGPFFLYRFGDKCQRIEGMRVTDEYICWDAPNQGQPGWWSTDTNQTWAPYHSKGATPARMPYHGQCDVEIHLCYYEQELPEEEEVITIQNMGDWPIGSYALPNVHRDDESMACPPGFVQKYTSLINRQAAFFDLQLLPSSLGSYFLDLIGHNFSALNVHYCERVRPDQVITEEDGDPNKMTSVAPMTDEEQARQ